MANTYTRLAALRPANTDEAELYEVEAGEYIVAEIFICNQDSSDRTYRVAITDSSAAASGEDWIHYDFPIQANMSHKFTIACGDGDTVRVKASVADKISFVLTGLKVT
jgi:hypothetical protein